MSSVFDSASCRIPGGLRDRLTNGDLHFVGIRLRGDSVEIQVQLAEGWKNGF
jgi:hypothetical protein